MRQNEALHRRLQRWRRSGTASVELAIILPTLALLLFGSLEVGMLVRSSLAVNHIANEAARMAAVGALPSQIDARVEVVARNIDTSQLTVTYQVRRWDVMSDTWSDWQTLGTGLAINDASTGNEIRVVVNYSHRLLIPGVTATLLHADQNGEVPLSATVITVRE